MVEARHRSSRIDIDLDAIAYNQALIMEHLPDQIQSIAVVKANAYGHGSLSVSQALEAQVHGFAVAVVDEGIELRQGGISKDIHVMGYCDPQQAQLFADYDLGCTIFSRDWLDQVHPLLDRQKPNRPLKLHLKVDTGMSRLGVKDLAEAQDMVDYISRYEDDFQLTSIFTHMATADADQDDQVKQVHQQFDRFQQFKQHLDLAGLNRQPYYHCSNSAMALWHPDLTMDAVRLGVSLYGLNPSNGLMTLPYDLKPALSLHSAISHVQTMVGGEKISYGATYQAKAGEVIGTLPIGYADGWQRAFQSYEVLVDGQPCELVGRICMDQCMVRLPRVFPVGTPVTLVGYNGGLSNSLESLAGHAGTIAYEVACLFSGRLPRYYTGN